MVVVCGFAAAAYFAVILTSQKITTVERSRVQSFIPLFIANAAFWSLFQQYFTVVEIYADRRVDRHLFGWQIPTEWVISFDPVFVIALAPMSHLAGQVTVLGACDDLGTVRALSRVAADAAPPRLLHVAVTADAPSSVASR